MKKQKLEITIQSGELNKTYSVLGTYDKENNIIEYQDKEEFIITNTIDLNKYTLVRQCKDYELYYSFKEGEETTNLLKMNDLNQNFEIIIKTLKIINKVNYFEIEYLNETEKIKYIIKY